jgi:hypothetical protein
MMMNKEPRKITIYDWDNKKSILEQIRKLVKRFHQVGKINRISKEFEYNEMNLTLSESM